MAKRFDIIINLNTFFDKVIELEIDQEIAILIEFFDPEKSFYQKKISAMHVDFSDFLHPNYCGFYFILKKICLNTTNSLYDDHIHPFLIEFKGGRETSTDIEMLKSRLVAKQPDPDINRIYQKLQRSLKKDTDIHSGVQWGNHYYKNIYFDHKIYKHAWEDLEDQKFEIVMN